MTTENITNVPRMRTIDNAYKEIKALDPQTDFTKRALRRMVKTNDIPSTQIGNKYLINLDKLLEILSCGSYNRNDTCTSSTG